VDSSNIIIAFINKEFIIRKYNVITKKLLVFRLLYFINSIPTLFITNYFTTLMSIGPYIKVILFLIIKLLSTTLIILGMP
jgi:hypothetical protein